MKYNGSSSNGAVQEDARCSSSGAVHGTTPSGHRSPGEPARRFNGSPSATDDPAEARLEALQLLTRRQIDLIGEDSSREGLRDTPARVAKSMSELTSGYSLNVHDVAGGAIFENEHQGMVLVRDIEMYSLCEHHLLPMFGRVHVAYVPDSRIIGLSKVPRLVNVFARRLQVQERLTQQIADAMEEVLQPLGVAVLIDAVHLCMMMRGVEKQNSSTVTTAFRGTLLDDYGAREEVYRLIRSRHRK